MRNTFIAALLSLAICPAMAADTSAPSEAAMTFVGQFSDDHLSGMLSRVGASQPAMMAAGQFNGSLLAVVFDAEIDKAVTEYGPEWQRAMASSWTGLMTDEQFTSLTNDGAESPYSDTYISLRSTAGAQMQQNAGDLFRKILSQVVGNTFKELGADVPTPTE